MFISVEMEIISRLLFWFLSGVRGPTWGQIHMESRVGKTVWTRQKGRGDVILWCQLGIHRDRIYYDVTPIPDMQVSITMDGTKRKKLKLGDKKVRTFDSCL